MRIGFFSLLTLLLIALKLAHVVTWSWWIVLLAPMGIYVLLWAVLILGTAALITDFKGYKA